ncbi:hypothetical protein ACTHGU_08655 [Chitinophagaceae bacterium MMS25-I14]
MKAIKVEYTVKPEYAETNKANIRKVIEELKSIGDSGVQYSVYTKEDGCSFVHFAIYSGEKNIIPTLEAFKAFSTQLKAEGLIAPPQSTHLDMVEKSFEM